MSGIGSGGKAGTPPIGHGPSHVRRSIRPRDDRQKPKKEPNEHNKEEESFSLSVEASLLQIHPQDSFEGTIIGFGVDETNIDSLHGRFHINHALNVQIQDHITLKIVKIEKAIQASITHVKNVHLAEPLGVIITPMRASIDQKLTAYKPSTMLHKDDESSGNIEGGDENNFIATHANMETHQSNQVHPTKTKAAITLSAQDMLELIKANEPDDEPPPLMSPHIQPKNDQGHDSRPQIDAFLKDVKQNHAAIYDKVQKLILGQNLAVPAGFSFFLAGLIFPEFKHWFGDRICLELKDTPAYKALAAEFNKLKNMINSLTNENWRLVMLPHPDGGAHRMIEMIVNLQTGHTPDGQMIDMRTLVTELHFTHPTKSARPIGILQIEACLLPNECSLTLRPSQMMAEPEKNDIEQLIRLFFARTGCQGHVLFASMASAPIDFIEIINRIKMMEQTETITT